MSQSPGMCLAATTILYRVFLDRRRAVVKPATPALERLDKIMLDELPPGTVLLHPNLPYHHNILLRHASALLFLVTGWILPDTKFKEALVKVSCIYNANISVRPASPGEWEYINLGHVIMRGKLVELAIGNDSLRA
jgi:hypothetical protein